MSVWFYVEIESISESHKFYSVACIHEDANSKRVSRIRIHIKSGSGWEHSEKRVAARSSHFSPPL